MGRLDCLLHDLFSLPAAIGQSCNTTVEGISLAWWYRKRQHALGVDRSQYS